MNCPTCEGLGRLVCFCCGGSGQARYSQTYNCPACGGTGEHVCLACLGTGKSEEQLVEDCTR